ncbi:hypothetical protein MKX03_023289 [Papaver bracteatum]|nr:hypothetical protein MKX03_023289 [Papaver bracteatum]
MANISSYSSSAFSFLIVLSVLLVAANNVPVSHGQTVGSLPVDQISGVVPKEVLGVPVTLTMITSTAGAAPLIFQGPALNPNPLKQNVLIIRDDVAPPINKFLIRFITWDGYELIVLYPNPY